ncbi:MAG: 2-amino-4-hydroxy-6-hydroxymethyldihydropteridine diphosphokinase [Anaerolineales bacterium]|nr:2-amino-4-hydroxy-6-hydroxymethyldihydropteridine diphosphokinase [Anaerolineales bacterium]
MTQKAFISLGSNIDPETNLPLAVHLLNAIGDVIAISMVYQNPAVGPTPQPPFLNAAVLVETNHPPQTIRNLLRAIEGDLGRVRGEDKYAPRTIDLDLCLLGNIVMENQDITLPDPDLLERAHLAVPLAELNPDFLHPVSGERLSQIAARLRAGADLLPRADVAERMESSWASG